MIKDGKKVGIEVRRARRGKGWTYIGGPKSLWHVHWREVNEWWGRSRLYSAYDPWLELESTGGGRDIRRLYYYKFAFQDDVLTYPDDASPNEMGKMVSNKQLAREMMEKMRTGGTLILPSTRDINGNKLWELVPRQQQTAGPDLLEYVSTLETKILEGMGVPEEVVVANEGGSGFSGRRIPQKGFHGLLSEIVYWMINDFDAQVLRPLVTFNFGIPQPKYTIMPFGLGDEGEVSSMPGDQIPHEAAKNAEFAVAV